MEFDGAPDLVSTLLSCFSLLIHVNVISFISTISRMAEVSMSKRFSNVCLILCRVS